MPTDSQKYLVGLVSPETLTAAESEEFHPARIDYESCDILEIRYDFFDESEWTGLSARIRKLVPKAIQLGTIRLKRDGGTFPDARAIERLGFFEQILNASDIPEWLDLERDCLHDYDKLHELTAPKGVKRRHQNRRHEQLRRRLLTPLQVRQKGKRTQVHRRIRHGRNR